MDDINEVRVFDGIEWVKKGFEVGSTKDTAFTFKLNVQLSYRIIFSI